MCPRTLRAKRPLRETSAVLKAVEANLLVALGLSARPKPINESSVPPYMLELYRRQLARRSRSPWTVVESPLPQGRGAGQCGRQHRAQLPSHRWVEWFVSSRLVLSCLVLPRLASSCILSSRLVSLVLSCLFSSYLVSSVCSIVVLTCVCSIARTGY